MSIATFTTSMGTFKAEVRARLVMIERFLLLRHRVDECMPFCIICELRLPTNVFLMMFRSPSP